MLALRVWERFHEEATFELRSQGYLKRIFLAEGKTGKDHVSRGKMIGKLKEGHSGKDKRT